MSIIIFLIILAILVLVHEFGHFIVAKKSGIRVDEFGLGFPPKIIGKKWGGTLYTLNAIPFGGFVKIFGEDAHAENISEEDKKNSFVFKSKWIQSAVLVAGVTMNMIFAWLVLSLGFFIGLPSPTDYSGFGQVKDVKLVITEVLKDSPAQKAGIIAGDTIVFAGSGKTSLQDENLNPQKVKDLISDQKNKNIEILIKRGESINKTFILEPTIDEVSGKRLLGIGMDSVGTLKLPAHLALLEGARTTWLVTKGTVVGTLGFLYDAITFQSDLSQVAGPVGIASVVGEARTLGFVYLLSIVALISINLAVINLLPIPALDGGRLLFVAIEGITGRTIKPSIVMWTNTIGFAFLLILMAVVTTHDIFKLF
ncbi:MAG: site-2 protease family protein [Parcubacteria group bacterium]